jgi:alpha-amylase
MSSSSAPRRISLALTLHNHQPVGNFGWVFDEIYEKAYLPMIEALERHPKVRLSLHYTGPLLEWFAAAQPEFLARVRALVERGQVEIVGGGLYEPILASLPAADRVAQLRRMRERIKELVGVAPQGAWLALRYCLRFPLSLSLSLRRLLHIAKVDKNNPNKDTKKGRKERGRERERD